jgi:hypothetical protein
MGCCQSIPNEKEGVPYSHFRSSLKPLDLVLFSGGDFVSGFIKYIEKKSVRKSPPGQIFSHVGIIVTSDILDHPQVLPGKIYILESTMSGKLGQHVYSIGREGKPFLGVQLRDFDALLPAYDQPNNTAIAIAPLQKNISDPKIKETFTHLFNQVNGIKYDVNFLSLLASAVPRLRVERDMTEKLLGTTTVDSDKPGWLFCSELVALVYRKLGIFPDTVNPENVLPMDFLGCDSDSLEHGGIPLVVKTPPIYIVSDRHVLSTKISDKKYRTLPRSKN